MKDNHITSILERAPFNRLSESELTIVRAHTANCSECLRAFEAAKLAALLIKERAIAEVEPSPFFQTRVMAALRERQALAETPASSLWRLWKATGALISGMAATVAALAVFTFFAPAGEFAQQDMTSAFSTYSAEEVILAPGNPAGDELSYDQVLMTIYESDGDAER